MAIKLSLKYKLLALLVLMPVLSLVFYLLMAKNLFEKDKMAYVFDTGQSTSSRIAEQVKSETNFLNYMHGPIISGLDKNSGKFDDISKLLLKKSVDLISMKIYKMDENGEYILFGEHNNKKYTSKIEKKLLSTKKEVFENLEPNEQSLKVIDKKKNIVAFYSRYSTKSDKKENQFITVMVHHSPNLFIPFLKKELFKNFLVNYNGEILIGSRRLWGAIPKEFMSWEFFKKISSENYQQKTLTAHSKNKSKTDYLVSYTRFPEKKLIAISFMDKSEALRAVDTLIWKSLLFLICIISASIVISLMASNKLTSTLRELDAATRKIGSKDFNIQVKVKSSDETGRLANNFNLMTKEISRLLSELRMYSKNLEKMVDERTEELNKALDMQKAMMDSLGQGFFIFDEDGTVLPVYSKASISMFDSVPQDKFVGDLLQIPEKEKESFRDFCNQLADEPIPFKDLVEMAPKKIISKDQRQIFLEYHPIREQNGQITGTVVVSTDKTEEVIALEQADLKNKYVQMIVKILGNRTRFLSFLSDYGNTLENIKICLDKNTSKNNQINFLMQNMHTIKGNASIFHLDQIPKYAHDYESELAKIKELPQKDQEAELLESLSRITNLEKMMDDFIKTNGKVLGISSWKNINPELNIAVKKLEQFHSILKENHSPDQLINHFTENILSQPVVELIGHYREQIQEIADDQEKELAPLEIEGGETRVICGKHGELFTLLVHAFRNAVDHGIETPEERVSIGKKQAGRIKITIRKELNFLNIKLTDDGRGIDPKIIRSKLKEKNIPFSEDESDGQIIQHIFDPDFSTRSIITDISGRGIGMNTIKDHVIKMNGRIVVASVPGRGTTLAIMIPST